MSRHIFQRMGLIESDGQPGHNWAEFSQEFDREDGHAMGTLGALAAHMVYETVNLRLATEYIGAAARFGAEAEPPIMTLREIDDIPPAGEIRSAKDLSTPTGWAARAFHDSVIATIQDYLAERPKAA